MDGPADDALSRRKFLGAALGAGTGLLLLLPPLLVGCGGGDDDDKDPEDKAWEDTLPGILSRIRPPTFPNRDFLITAYGAVAGANVSDDVVKANTAAIANAIAACNVAGGGRVVVPSGTFMTGAIRLLSNVNLHLPDTDSVLLFDTDPHKYPNVLTRWEGNDLFNYSPPIPTTSRATRRRGGGGRAVARTTRASAAAPPTRSRAATSRACPTKAPTASSSSSRARCRAACR